MKPIKRELGTCDYPEHWPDDIWETDAKQMVELGLKWVPYWCVRLVKIRA